MIPEWVTFYMQIDNCKEAKKLPIKGAYWFTERLGDASWTPIYENPSLDVQGISTDLSNYIKNDIVICVHQASDTLIGLFFDLVSAKVRM